MIDSDTGIVAKKKILLIAPQPFFLNRGTPLNVKAMAEELAKAGYHIDLYVYPFGEEVQIQGVTILRSPKLPGITQVPIGPSCAKFFLDIPMFLKSIGLIIKNRYTVIHGTEEGAIMAGVLGLLTGLPYIYDMDSSMPEQLVDRGYLKSRFCISLLESIENFFLKRSKAVLTVCSSLTKKAKSIVDASKVYQIEDFPVEGSSEFNQEELRKIKKELSIDSQQVIVYTGNFEPYQGLDLLLQSFARVPSKAILLLVGGGNRGDKKREHYETLATQLGVSERVKFAGLQPLERMGAYMGLADLLASPRIEGENTPLKIYSYMAANKPIIATRIFSHTQVLTDEISYLSIPEVSAFKETLEQALENSEDGKKEREKKAKLAKELVDRCYSRKAFKERLISLYQDILEDSSKTPLLEEKRKAALG